MMYYTTKGKGVQGCFEAHTGGSEFAVEINDKRTAQSGGSDYGFLANIAIYNIGLTPAHFRKQAPD